MDLRRHLADPGLTGPANAKPNAAIRPGLHPQASPSLRQPAPPRPSLAEARRREAGPKGQGARRSRTPAGNATATWISPGWFRLDLSYELLGEHPDGTTEVLNWPRFSVRAETAGLRTRASGTSPVCVSLEVPANQPIEVRLTLNTLGGLLANLMGEKWGECLVVDNAGQITTGPLPGHQAPTRKSKLSGVLAIGRRSVVLLPSPLFTSPLQTFWRDGAPIRTQLLALIPPR